MKRKIISIDEEKCNGCGQCITACAEGALALVKGKARLVKETFCDGLGDCIGECPTGALRIEERKAAGFDAEAVQQHLRQKQGAVAEPVSHGEEGGGSGGRNASGGGGTCPGLRMRAGVAESQRRPSGSPTSVRGHALASDLAQWPVQLHLVQPGDACFKNRELAVISTCAPLASADMHWRFIRGRGVVVACPKLDRTENYAAKLADILEEPTLPAVVVVRMEVPCCGGLTRLVRQAAKQSGRKDLTIREVTVGLDGNLLGERGLDKGAAGVHDRAGSPAGEREEEKHERDQGKSLCPGRGG